LWRIRAALFCRKPTLFANKAKNDQYVRQSRRQVDEIFEAFRVKGSVGLWVWCQFWRPAANRAAAVKAATSVSRALSPEDSLPRAAIASSAWPAAI
jgi:hypothetical protein